MVAPLRAFQSYPVPLDARPTKQLIEAERSPFRQNITKLVKSDEPFHQSMYIAMRARNSNRTS